MSYRNTILATPGLVGYWRLGEASGTVAQDETTNNRDGMRSGATPGVAGLLTGDADTAYSFDGINDAVDISGIGDLSATAISMECWFNGTAMANSFGHIIGTRNDTDADFFITRIRDQNLAEFRLRRSNGTAYTVSAPITPGTTYHAVLVMDGSMLRAYLNGVQVALIAASGAMASGARTWSVGRPFGGPHHFAGRIDEFALYDSALSAATVAAHYQAGPNPPPDPGAVETVAVTTTPATVQQGQSTTMTAVVTGTVDSTANPALTLTLANLSTGLSVAAGAFPEVIDLTGEIDGDGAYEVTYSFTVTAAPNSPLGVRSITLNADESTTAGSLSGSGAVTVTAAPEPPPIDVWDITPASDELNATVRIGGVVVHARDIDTDHSVNAPVATGSVTTRAPKPAHIQRGDIVTITAGYGDQSMRIFSGTVAEDDNAFSERGGMVAVALEGHGARAMHPQDVWLGVQGPIRIFSWWRTIMNHLGVPDYWADEVEDVDGNWLYVGDNHAIVDGVVLIDARRAPGAELGRLAELLGYRSYETPTHVRLSRVSGLPTTNPSNLVLFQEGVNCRSVRRVEQGVGGIANYWDVRGAEYTDGTGAEVKLRSIPATVTPDHVLFGRTGIRRLEERDAALDTLDLVDACRNVREVDRSLPSYVWTWTTRGRPDIHPGEQVALMSPKVGPQILVGGEQFSVPVGLWVLSVSHRIGERGWVTTMTGWAGNGAVLPQGSDCMTVNLIGAQGIHLGDEALANYRNPAPNGNTSGGREHRITFTLPHFYSTASISCLLHGANSYMGDTETNVSRYEYWQGGEKKTSGELPFLPENLSRVLPYGPDNRHWSPASIPMGGGLSGTVELRIISGQDTGYDDFEVCNAVARFCGVGSPAIVGDYTP